MFETDGEADDRMLGSQPSLPPHSPQSQKDTCQDVRVTGYQAVSIHCQVCVYTHSKGTNNHTGTGPDHTDLFFLGKGGGTRSKKITLEITGSQTLSLDAQNSATQVPFRIKQKDYRTMVVY